MEIEAYILIGGRSSRMGRSKAFADIGGVPLARHAFETVNGSGITEEIKFVAGNEAQFAIEAAALNAPFIFDLVPGRGPLGGLHAALSYARTPWIFLLACDMPLVSPEMIGILASEIIDGVGVVLPEQADGRLQPLCALYNTAIAGPIITETIELPRVSPRMTELAMKLEPKIIRFESYSNLPGAATFFSNINTPDELEIVRKLF